MFDKYNDIRSAQTALGEERSQISHWMMNWIPINISSALIKITVSKPDDSEALNGVFMQHNLYENRFEITQFHRKLAEEAEYTKTILNARAVGAEVQKDMNKVIDSMSSDASQYLSMHDFIKDHQSNIQDLQVGPCQSMLKGYTASYQNKEEIQHGFNVMMGNWYSNDNYQEALNKTCPQDIDWLQQCRADYHNI